MLKGHCYEKCNQSNQRKNNRVGRFLTFLHFQKEYSIDTVGVKTFESMEGAKQILLGALAACAEVMIFRVMHYIL
jgi:hypothetical protein